MSLAVLLASPTSIKLSTSDRTGHEDCAVPRRQWETTPLASKLSSTRDTA